MTELASPASAADAGSSARATRRGALLVFFSALLWSLGGAIARYIEAPDPWAVIFWRSLWATAFLIAYMVWRDGWRGAMRLFRDMGLPGLAVAACFATASTCFVVALSHTTVANILLIQAGVPLIAALFGWIALREKVSGGTWVAIFFVIVGVAVMVSESLGGSVSPIGDGLALAITCALATATVITRRFAHVRMTPATCLGTIFAALLALTQASLLEASGRDMVFLFAFGVLNLGLGLACFATGARMIPAAMAALLGTFETILGPVWVWLAHAEVPSGRTLIGGGIVFAALLVHIAREFRRHSQPRRPGVTGLPAPN